MESPILTTKALVLSSGGMFGAYQAGAWEVLSETFKPDIVVGASVGSLNGWAIAGGCRPRDLTDHWLKLHEASPVARNGSRPLDAKQLHAWIRELHLSYQPQIPYGVVLTDLLRLRPTLFTTPNIGWEHLAASCAIFGVLPQMRIGGRLYSDGGLLEAVPLWAACQMGATEIVAINVLPRTPGSILQACVQAFRAVAPKPPSIDSQTRITVLAPDGLLGGVRDSIYWSEANIRKWMEAGRDAALAMAQHAK